MIKLQVIGHLGKDAIVNNVNGKTVINFSVAHTEKFTSNGEKKEKTIWVECGYWTDKTAIAPYLKKGTQVYVEGQPDIRVWESNTGSSGASLQLRVSSVQLLGSAQQGNIQQQPQQQTTQQPANNNQQSAYQDDEVSDLPF